MDSLAPMPLVRLQEPFNDPDWLFSIKYDGFRALAYIDRGTCSFVSRNQHVLRRFTSLGEHLADQLHVPTAILDGEIVCLDPEGRSRFNDLMFGRCEPVYAAFDLLALGGTDLRNQPLTKRTRRLNAVLRDRPTRVLLVQSVKERGVELFKRACDLDLEGIVGKWAKGRYRTDGTTTSWVKIKNPRYSQAEGRRELFERRRGDRPAPRAKAARLLLA